MKDREIPSSGLEFSSRELRAFGRLVTDELVRYLEGLGEGMVAPENLEVDAVRKAVREPLPRTAQGLDQAWTDVLSRVLPHSVRVGHPRFLAWIRTSPLGGAVFSESLAAALNQSVAVWGGAPAAAEIERLVIGWLIEVSGYHPEAGGLLTSGGSMVNFTGLAAARSRLDPGVRRHGLAGRPPQTVYLTSQSHYSLVKAVEMLGLGREWTRNVPVDDRLRMDPEALRRAIRQDRSRGFRPMAAAATLGTTGTGVCDPISSLAEVCSEEGVWLHVDGAYGGLAGLVPGKENLTAGLERADSFVLDPHKNLFMPFEAGCLLVRDPRSLLDAFAVETDYLPNTRLGGEGRSFEAHHYRDYGPQLSRSFRALKIYLSLKAYGVEAIAGEIAREYALAARLGELIDQAEDFWRLAEVNLGVVAFQFLPAGGISDQELNRSHTRLVEILQRRGKVYLSRVRVRGRVGFRACFVSHRTGEKDLPIILEEIRTASTEL